MLYTNENLRGVNSTSFDLFGYPLEPPTHSTPNRSIKPTHAHPERYGPVVSQAKTQSDVPRCDIDTDDEDETDAAEADVEPTSGDTPDTYVAKRMWKTLCADLSGDTIQDLPGERDLLGQTCSAIGLGKMRLYRKYDALVWMFDLNPDGAAMPFDWVCAEIGLDHEAVRRITARHMRTDLKRLLGILSEIVGYDHAVKCQEALQEYVTLTGWHSS